MRRAVAAPEPSCGSRIAGSTNAERYRVSSVALLGFRGSLLCWSACKPRGSTASAQAPPSLIPTNPAESAHLPHLPPDKPSTNLAKGQAIVRSAAGGCDVASFQAPWWIGCGSCLFGWFPLVAGGRNRTVEDPRAARSTSGFHVPRPNGPVGETRCWLTSTRVSLNACGALRAEATVNSGSPVDRGTGRQRGVREALHGLSPGTPLRMVGSLPEPEGARPASQPGGRLLCS